MVYCRLDHLDIDELIHFAALYLDATNVRPTPTLG